MKYKRTLATNPDGTFRRENGSLVWIDGEAAVKQELEDTLKTVRGEDEFDDEHGLDIFEATGAAPPIVEREIRTALLQDDRVDEVTDVVIADPEENRETEVEVSVALVDGVGLSLSETL